MDIQEREHWDHVMGCYDNEFQAAYEGSRVREASKPNPDLEKIAKAKEAGLFVVIAEVPIYCPHTDGAMGCKDYFEGAFESREEAIAQVDELHESSMGEYGARIEHKENEAPEADQDDSWLVGDEEIHF